MSEDSENRIRVDFDDEDITHVSREDSTSTVGGVVGEAFPEFVQRQGYDAVTQDGADAAYGDRAIPGARIRVRSENWMNDQAAADEVRNDDDDD